MSAPAYAIPLQVGAPQMFSIALSGVTYQLSFLYRNDTSGLGGWTVDIDDASGNPILEGVPLITGADLLAQYPHLGLGGSLYVQTTSNPDAVPTFANLGDDAQVYWVPSGSGSAATSPSSIVATPVPQPFPQAQIITTTSGQTVFTLNAAVAIPTSILVVLDGATLIPNVDYSVSGVNLTLVNATLANQNLYVTPII